MGKNLPKICFDCGDIKPFGEDNWISKSEDEEKYISLSKEYFGEFIQDSCPFCLNSYQTQIDMFRRMNGN